jgi:hypothetical protein
MLIFTVASVVVELRKFLRYFAEKTLKKTSLAQIKIYWQNFEVIIKCFKKLFWINFLVKNLFFVNYNKQILEQLAYVYTSIKSIKVS